MGPARVEEEVPQMEGLWVSVADPIRVARV